MKIEGIDWTEISKCFGIIDDDYEGGNDEEIITTTKKYLLDSLDSDREKEVAELLRDFTTKLYNNSVGVKSNASIWKGLMEVENDFTIIKYSYILFEYMWY